MSSFEFTDEDGDKLTARPMLGHPAILLKTSPNGAVIPPDRLEEVIAGLRDMARQAGGQPGPLPIPAGTRTTVLHWAADLVAAYTGSTHDANVRMLRRVADGQPRPNDPQIDSLACAPRRRLTEPEHDRAWHAIEGAAGEEGADPGTVLNAVLRALDIDPPADVQAAPARPTVVIHEKPADEAPIVVVRP